MLRLEINNRPLVPTRLIPLVSGWDFPPDIVARILAHRETFYQVYIPSIYLQSDGTLQPMHAKEWDACIADIEVLTRTFKSRDAFVNENYSVWRMESIKVLYAGSFVWLDDLENAWYTAYSDDRITLVDERPGDRSLNLHPRIPTNLSPLIYEGFEPLITAHSTSAESPSKNIPAVKEQALDVPMATATPSATQNRIILNSEYCNITFEGRTLVFKITKGVRYIDYLIRNQGKEIHVSELYYAINPPDSDVADPILSVLSAEQLKELGLSVGDLGGTGDILTLEGKQRLKQSIKQINDKIEDAIERRDEARQATFEALKEKILSHIAAETGLGGRTRKASSSHTRMVDTVSKCIRTAIKKIKGTCPELGNHLSCIKMGATYIYAPHPPMEWA